MALDLTLIDCHESRMIQKIETILEGKAGDDVQQIEHNGKKLVSYTFQELSSLRKYYLQQYRTELKKAGHLPSSNKIKTRFI